MKFLLCLALCFAAAQAGLVGVPSAVSYGSPYAYSAPVASIYNAPAAYSAYAGYPTTYSAVGGPVVRAAYASPSVYTAPSVYAAPSVYSAPRVYTTLLKK